MPTNNRRTITLGEAFSDLNTLIEAFRIMKSEERIKAIKRLQEDQKEVFKNLDGPDALKKLFDVMS